MTAIGIERGPALRRSEFLDEARYYCDGADERAFRSHPAVIGVVEELGKAANGEHATLAILEIPFTEPFGWHIDEADDGREWINEDHRRWCWNGQGTEETVS